MTLPCTICIALATFGSFTIPAVARAECFELPVAWQKQTEGSLTVWSASTMKDLALHYSANSATAMHRLGVIFQNGQRTQCIAGGSMTDAIDVYCSRDSVSVSMIKAGPWNGSGPKVLLCMQPPETEPPKPLKGRARS